LYGWQAERPWQKKVVLVISVPCCTHLMTVQLWVNDLDFSMFGGVGFGSEKIA
jgi:hypothetical protein